MQVTTAARHASISESVRRYVQDRLRKIERLEPRPARAEVLFSSSRGSKRVETHLIVAGAGQFIAHATASTYRSAIDAMLDRLTRQVKRNRARDHDHQAPKLTQ
jgi:ribosome hibernation promoting factor